MGEIKAPSDIPKDFRDHYSKALITHNGGFELAACLYLRILIEQFWKSLALVAAQRPTGDELGNAYHATLPVDVLHRFPNLLTIFNDLSAAIHTATVPSTLFENSREGIARHFELRRVFQL